LSQKRRKFSPEIKEEAVKAVIETSRPIAQVATELSIVEGTLGNWVNAYRREHAGDEPPLTVSERIRLREAERCNRFRCRMVAPDASAMMNRQVARVSRSSPPYTHD
jgi:transposase